MKKIVLLLSFVLAGFTAAFAQIPNGSTAPNFTVTDIDGNVHTLYDLLDQGKTVYLDIFATWCVPCWNYHQTHALRDIWDQYGPNGTDEAYVISIEGDSDTSIPCIWDDPGCVGGTVGDWTDGTPYPIADYPAIMGLYQVTYYPTIFMICPADKKVYEVGQQGASGLWNARSTYCPPLAVATTLNSVENTICYGSSTGSIDISVSGGSPPYTYIWSNGATTQDLTNIPAGTYECTVTNAQGWTGETGPIIVEDPFGGPLELSVVNVEEVGCNGVLGSIEVDGSGGWSNFSYSWNNGMSGNYVGSLNPGSYTCTLTDDAGCTTTLTTVLGPPDYPVASIAPPAVITCLAPTQQLEASATGGVSGIYEFQWFASNGGHIVSGENTYSPTIDAGGNYTVQVTDAVSTCSGFATVIVDEDIDLPEANAGPDTALTCVENQVVLDGSGSSGPDIEIEWAVFDGGHIVSGGNSFTPEVDSTGGYVLIVSNTANGCTFQDTTMVTGNNVPPSVTANGDTLTCTVLEVTLTTTNNAQNPGYAWTGPNGFSANTPEPLVQDTGMYNLVLTDSVTGCTNTATALVELNATPPEADAEGGTLTCVLTVVEIEAISNTPNATFAWTGPNGFTSNQATPEVGEVGTYDLVVTDPANGCTAAAVAEVDQDVAPPVASAVTPGNLNCTVLELELDGSGSSQGNNIEYAWSTADGNIVSGANTVNPLVDAVGTYDLVVTNTDNGCTSTASAAVVQSPVVTAAVNTFTNVSCNGGSDGSATAEAGGGNNSYTYAWSNGETTASVSGLTAGTYTVVITDGENCTAEASVVISQPAVLQPNASATPQTANGVNDGTATAAPVGGTGDYTYSWSNGETTQTITDLAPGTYTVVVTDENNCTAQQTVTVNAFNCAMTGSASGTDVTCFGAGNGTAVVELLGANDPVNYTWSNGENTASIENLTPGTYTVDVIDATNCAATYTVTIDEPTVLEANASATGETMQGANDGTATAAPTGGTGSYTYSWSNGESTQTITNLAPGTYTVVITDENGCTDEQSVTVNSFNCALSAQANIQDVSCFGLNDGSVSVEMSGGAEPYSYNWSNGANTATLEDLTPGTYTATITDDNSCELIISTTIGEPAVLGLDAVVENSACTNDPTGAIATTASGGVGNYTYNWSNGANTASVENLAPGTYTVVLTDENGCTLEESYAVISEDNTAPVITAEDTDLPLSASGSAMATLQTLGASVTDNCAVASVSITPNEFTCDDLGEQEVTIVAIDDAGNETSTVVTVTVVDNIAPTVTCPENVVACWYDNTVSYAAPVAEDNCLSSGGEWKQEEGLASGSAFPTGETRQVFTFTDQSGNVGSCSFTVTITEPVVLEASNVTHDVNNQGVGAIDIQVSGGTTPYNFVWTNADGDVIATTEDINGLTMGTYYVEIKDANGCVLTTEGIVVDNTTGIQEPVWLGGVSLRPNPTSGLTQVVFATVPPVQLEISVVDATGRVVLTQQVDQQTSVRLDCTGLAEGVYLVRFRSAAEVGVRKLMIGR
ncbi:MAG: T9SS type A sorting domain-containing protein [Bacteroidetes bacterium]|nr:MAG: T9SS type A sorting domain-containing protein [Bacteroidota bacterium]